ncbi:MAG: hypothetical protein PWP65_1050 [Clostridia bacterium]|nr:hypothetical protein [Clostridia bacterium]
MATELEKIDILRRRLGLSYREAKEALDAAGGDVLEALIKYEEGNQAKAEAELESWRGKLTSRIREILRQGNATRIKLKKDGKVVAEIPATVGALGIVGILASTELAILAGLSTVAALFNRYSLEIERPFGEIEEHNLDVDGKVDN